MSVAAQECMSQNQAKYIMSTDTRSLTDCQFFLRGTCSKGVACPFRHCQAALLTDRTCENWLAYACYDVACPYRHGSTGYSTASSIGATKDATSVEICKFFMHGRCSKGDQCTFRHVVNEETNKISNNSSKPIVTKRKATDILNRYSIRHKAAEIEQQLELQKIADAKKSPETDVDRSCKEEDSGALEEPTLKDSNIS